MKGKSYSYANPSAHIPDYEETYCGIKFTYGLTPNVTYHVTIEIESLDDIKIIDEEMFNSTTLRELSAIDNGEFGINSTDSSSWILKKAKEIFYADKNLAVCFNKNYYPSCLILIRNVGNTADEKNTTFYTDEMLTKVRSKFRKLVKKRDGLDNYMIKEQWLHTNAMYNTTKDMTEEQLVEFCKNETIRSASKWGINFRYLTTDMIVDMCHKYIDEIMLKITKHNIEMLNKNK